jgi:transposase-like protein
MRGVAYPIGERELLMRLHKQGVSWMALSRQSGIRREVLTRWWTRYQEEGRAGLEPRSRRPRHFASRLAVEIEQQILNLRSRGWGPARIALALKIGHSSVHRILLRHGRNRLRQPTPRVFRRYEKSRPGELLHLDLKYLYRWPQGNTLTPGWMISVVKQWLLFAPIVPVRMPRRFWKKSLPLCLIESKRS